MTEGPRYFNLQEIGCRRKRPCIGCPHAGEGYFKVQAQSPEEAKDIVCRSIPACEMAGCGLPISSDNLRVLETSGPSLLLPSSGTIY